MTRLPSKIQYMSQTFTVRKGDVMRTETGAKTLGTVFSKNNEIRLRHSLQGDSLRAVFLHELLHIVFGFNSDAIEEVVDRVAYGILELLRSNPKLADFLMEVDDD